MKRRALSFLLLIWFMLPVRGDDPHIARFNVQRAFDEYQLTKDLRYEAMLSINQTGPQTDPIRRDQKRHEELQKRLAELTAMFKEGSLREPKGLHFRTEEETVTAQLRLYDARHALGGTEEYSASDFDPDTIRRQIDGLEKRVKQAVAGGPEQEHLKLELQIALNRLRIYEAVGAIEGVERELSLRDEARLQRTRILNEIWALAAKLRTERGFTLLVPVNGPDEDQFLTVIVPVDCEDVTDALLERLNQEYAAKKGK
jgi:hypothetical protein